MSPARALPRLRYPAVVTAALCIVAAGCVATPQAAHVHATTASAAATPFQRDLNAGMSRMMQDMHAPGYSGDADADFLAMMIPHHAGAVDMARLVLQYGHDPATRRLAEEIIATQTVEIESMMRRLAALRQLGVGRSTEFPALGGTRGP
ncbi:MAG: DUF305 domain-containing protein [Burkholderiaceae bacterium]